MAAFGLLIQFAPAGEPSGQPELETVVVTDEQPGPGMWKVSKGDHVMWILASYSTLPKDMTWRSHQVEARIAESQEVLYAGSVNIKAGIGLLRGLTLVPAALKAGKIPGGRTLKDVLPADTWNKWLALRLKYIGKDDDVEKWRPAIALDMLRNAARRSSGLQGGPNVYATVGKFRQQHKVRRNMLPAVVRTIRVENPRGMLKSAQKLELPDLECFTRGLDKVEPDLERDRELANAWSRGDIDRLRSLHLDRPLDDALEDECGYVLMMALNEGDSPDAANARKMMADVRWHMEQASVQAQLDWIAAARAALERNASTFAVLPVADLLRAGGHLEKLRALGYAVEDPI